MTPTPHLRFVKRRVWSERHLHEVNERILQQLWRAHHIAPGEKEAREEWRDVAVVDETEEKT